MTDNKRKYVGRTLNERIERVDLTAINHEALAGKLNEDTTLHIAQDYAKALGLRGWTELRRNDLITFINRIIERLQQELADAVEYYVSERDAWHKCGKELFEDDVEERMAVNRAARNVLDRVTFGKIAHGCPTVVMPEEFADRVAYAFHNLDNCDVSLHIAQLSGYEADYHFTIMRKGFAQLGITPNDRVGGVTYGHYLA